MRAGLFSWAIVTALGFSLTSTQILADVPGSEDHPITGRYAGSEIRGYNVRDFDVYAVYENNALKNLEGAVTEISYTLPPEASVVSVSRNFAKRLSDQDFRKLVDCDTAVYTKPCPRDVAYGVGQMPIPKMWVDPFNFSYQLYRAADQGNVYVAVLTSQNNGNTLTQLSIIEQEALAYQVVDAEKISRELAEQGQIALYGIQFDTDSAEIKPESYPILAELGAFLGHKPDIKILIVGHTDDQGSLAYNMDLSARRAGSVRAYLSAAHGIASDRMQPEGVGYLAPVASNATSDGRALNRRVVIMPK